MAAPVAFVVDTLGDAVLLSASHAFPCRVTVGVLQVRQAPLMLEILTKQLRPPARWILPNINRLRKLSRLSHELDIATDVVIPLLSDHLLNPTVNLDSGRLLRRYGWSISHLARSLEIPDGGSFYRDEVAPIGASLRRFAQHLHKGTKKAPWFVVNLATIKVDLARLKNLVVQLPLLDHIEDPDTDSDTDSDGSSEDDGPSGGPVPAKAAKE